MKRIAWIVVVVLVVASGLAVGTDAWGDRFDGDRKKHGDRRVDREPPRRPFQIAFVSRIETFFGGLALGQAESIQSKRGPEIIGDWTELVVFGRPEDPSDPNNQREIVLFRDTLETKHGTLHFESLHVHNPSADGAFLYSSEEDGTLGSGTITGGTGKYEGAEGEAIVSGRITFCELGTEFCGETDFPVPPGYGLRADCYWILRGTLPAGRSGDD